MPKEELAFRKVQLFAYIQTLAQVMHAVIATLQSQYFTTIIEVSRNRKYFPALIS